MDIQLFFDRSRAVYDQTLHLEELAGQGSISVNVPLLSAFSFWEILAKSYSNLGGSGKRFNQLLTDFGGAELTLICTVLWYRKTTSPRVKAYIEGKFGNINAQIRLMRIYYLPDHALTLAEINSETSLDESDKKEAAKFIFADYIYKQYRCFVVHEARTPQDPFGDKKEPFYVGNSSTGEYKLFVPRTYIYKIFNDILTNYKEHCLANRHDPFEHIEDDVTDTTFY